MNDEKITSANECHAVRAIGTLSPHPKSYRPDLPMHGQTNRQAETRRYPWPPMPNARAGSSPTKNCWKVRWGMTPHPDGYRPDLPTYGYTDAQLMKPTKEDRAIWAARPEIITPNAFEPCDLDGKGKCRVCGRHPDDANRGGTHRVPVVEPLDVAELGQAAPIACVLAAQHVVPVAELVRCPSCADSPEPGKLNHSPGKGTIWLPCRMCRGTTQIPANAKVPRAPREKSANSSRPQSERDAIRRAYIAFLKGRAQLSDDNTHYLVSDARTGKTKPAPWAEIVKAAFPNPYDFQRAAQAWQSPKNQRTLATH